MMIEKTAWTLGVLKFTKYLFLNPHQLKENFMTGNWLCKCIVSYF